jgi:hypothetical protein
MLGYGENFEGDTTNGGFATEGPELQKLEKAVKLALERAVRGHPELAELMKDEEFRTMMLANIEYDEGRGVRWFQDKQIDISSHPAFTEEKEEMEELGNRAEKIVEKYFESLQGEKGYKEAAKKYLAESDTAATDVMSKAVKVLESIVDDKENVQKRQRAVLKVAQEIVRASGRALSSDGAKAFIATLFREAGPLRSEEKDLILAADQKIVTHLTEAVPSTGNFDVEGAKKVLLVLERVASLPPEEWSVLRDSTPPPAPILDRNTIRQGLRSASEKRIQLAEERKRFLIKSFPERARYLYLLAGADAKRLIAKSTREDGKLDFETMQAILVASGVPVPADLETNAGLNQVDSAKVRKLAETLHVTEAWVKEVAQKILTEGKFAVVANDAYRAAPTLGGPLPEIMRFFYGNEVVEEAKKRGFTDPDTLTHFIGDFRGNLPITDAAAWAFRDVWDSKALEKLLHDGGYTNPAGFDADAAITRALMPPAVSSALEKHELNIGRSALQALSKPDEVKAYPDSKKKLSDLNGLPDQILNAVLDEKSKHLDEETAFDVFAFLLSEENDTGSTALDRAKGDTNVAATLNVCERRGTQLVLPEAKRQEFLTALGQIEVSAHAISHLKTLHISGFPTSDLKEEIKLSAREFSRIAGVGAEAWWNWLSSVPRNFVSDPEWEKLVARERAVGNFEDTLGDALSHFDTQDHGMQKSFEVLFQRDAAKHLAEKDVTNFILLPGNDKKMFALAQLYAMKQRQVKDALDPHWQQYDRSTRQKAFFLANQPGVDAATARKNALEYLRDPANFDLTDAENHGLRGFIAKDEKMEILEGTNVLDTLRHELKVHVFEHALDLLQTTAGSSEGETLLDQKYHFENWFNDPKNAELPLQTILQDLPDSDLQGKDALIRAFCHAEVVTLPNSRILKFGDAQKYIADIQKHLKSQRDDFLTGHEQQGRKERFTSPLEFFRAGANSIGNMLQSGDRVKQGLAITMLIAGGVVLWQEWKKKGLGRNLILGIPLFFGADILVKDMTGKGVIERLGLTYMKPKDRNAAVEQFLRRHEKTPGYEDLGKDAGYEAMQELMSSKNALPVAELLAWRDIARRGGSDSKFSDGAPPVLEQSARKIMRKFGSLDAQMYPREKREQMAYELLLKGVEALCIDVAQANAATPNVETGMRIIRSKYVTFDAEYLQGFAESLKDIAASRPGGGFSMLDVLVFERPTPAMRDTYYANETNLEWIFRGTGISLAFAKEKIAEGWTYAQVYAAHAVEKGGEYAKEWQEGALDTGESVWEWLKATYPKAEAEVLDNLSASWNFIVRTAKSAGVLVYAKAPGVIEWTYDTAIATGTFTLEVAQKLYRELHRHEVTGNAIEGFDALCKRFFGGTLTELILLRSTVERDDEHVKKLSEFRPWRERLLRQLGTIIENPPTDEQLVSWVQEVNEGQEIGNLTSYEKMRIFEIVKRNIFSHLIASRLRKINTLHPGEKLPQKLFIDWTKFGEDELSLDVQKTYGLQSVRLLGAARTLAGSLEEFSDSLKPGVIRSSLNFLHWGVDWATRDEATEYLTQAIEEYVYPFEREAEEALKNDPEKLERYKDYLETIIANAVIEMTMGARESDDPTLPAKDTAVLALTITQAKNFLEYLKVLRGSSADVDKAEHMDLTVFKREEGSGRLNALLKDGEFVRKMQQFLPSGPNVEQAEGGAATPVLPVSSDEIVALKAKGVATPEERKEHLEKLGKLPSQDEREIREKFDTALRALSIESPQDPVTRNAQILEYADFLRGISPSKVEEFENTLLPFLKDHSNLLTLSSIRDREKSPEGRKRLQHLLDRAVIEELQTIIVSLRKISVKEVAKDANYKQWKDAVVELYAATASETDKVSDVVSMLLEYLVKADNPTMTFKEYEALLEQTGKEKIGRPLLVPQESSYPYGGTRKGLFGYASDYKPAARSRWSAKLTEGFLSGVSERLGLLKAEVERN